jgi:hypothetical protein
MVKIKEAAPHEPTRNEVCVAISARTGYGITPIAEKLDATDSWTAATAAIADGRFDDAVALLDETKKAT